MRYRSLSVLPILALMACQEDQPATGAAAVPTATSQFDGVYRGPMTLTRNERGNCGTGGTNSITVRDGRGSILFNPAMGWRASGRVSADGSFSLAGTSLNPEIFSGKIEDGVATGNFDTTGRGGGCHYSFEFRKTS